MMVLLVTLTCLAAVLLLVVVAVNVIRINRGLYSIGGTPTSWLAKIRFGLRAIETETGQLAPLVTNLNTGLGALDGGLRQVEQDLQAAVTALKGGKS
ncbi:MAG: hypothetical protein ABIR71_11825 [Chthoniobacterales bacterium]